MVDMLQLLAQGNQLGLVPENIPQVLRNIQDKFLYFFDIFLFRYRIELLQAVQVKMGAYLQLEILLLGLLGYQLPLIGLQLKGPDLSHHFVKCGSHILKFQHIKLRDNGGQITGADLNNGVLQTVQRAHHRMAYPAQQQRDQDHGIEGDNKK